MIRLERRLAVVEIGATIGEQLQTMGSRLASLEAKIIRTPDASKVLAPSQAEMRAAIKRIEDEIGKIADSWSAVLAAQDVIGQRLAAIEQTLAEKKLRAAPRFEAPTYGKRGKGKSSRTQTLPTR
jgi:septal ring factor EnvC (AmiA/AmiB activator)